MFNLEENYHCFTSLHNYGLEQYLQGMNKTMAATAVQNIAELPPKESN